MYTLISLAHGALPTYVTDDPTARSQMLVFKMLFAAITSMVIANTITSMVSFFGGQKSQRAWILSALVFGLIGLVFMALNILFVHERVEVPENNEKFFTSIGYAFKNKYWVISLFFSLFTYLVLYMNLSISVYYLNVVEHNMGLMGLYVTASNVPSIIVMLFMPAMLKKMSKQKLVIIGTVLMILGQIGFLFVPVGDTIGLVVTACVRGMGFSFHMALSGALTADTIDYGEWKTGVRVQTMLISANSVGIKVGQGLLISLFGIFINAIGYNGELIEQSQNVVNGINIFYRWVPFVLYAGLLICSLLFGLEKQLPDIRRELVERRGNLE